MSKKVGTRVQDKTGRNIVIFIVAVFGSMILMGICAGIVASQVVPQPAERRIQVCEVTPKLIVTIPESEFDREVYSKDLEDCK